MATSPRRVEARIGPPDSSPVLQKFYTARGDFDVVIGPLGSGKTFGVLQRNLAMAAAQTPNRNGVRMTRCGVLRNSWPELETATLPDIERFFGPMGARITRGIPPSMVLEARLQDGTTLHHEMIFVAGLDQPDSEEKLRGHQWTWMWANELRQIPLGVVGMAIARTGRFPTREIDGASPSWQGGLADTNAFDVDHALFRQMSDPPAGWNFFVQPGGILRKEPQAPWETNPLAENLHNLPPGYYERIAKGRPDDWVRVNLANEFIFHIDGRPVHPEYIDAVHCAPLALPVRRDLPVTLGVDFGRCYDDETEVLTEHGWRLFRDVEGARVATLNPRTFALEYTEAEPVVFDYTGDLIHFGGVNYDFRVTPEHRVPFTHRESPDAMRFTSAEDLAQRRTTSHRFFQVQTRGGWEGVLPERLPGGFSPSVYARFMGWWLAEGSVERGTNRIAITQKKPAPELERVLFETGLDWHKRHDGYRASHRELRAYLGACGGSTKRTMPRELLDLPPANLIEFIDAFTLGDGHRRFRHGVSEEHIVFSTSRALVDAMQEIAVRVGWGSGLRWQKARDSRMRDGRIIRGNGIWVVAFKKRAERAELLPGHVTREPYVGKIYCLTVPHHTLCVRRRGKVMWNGNTPAATVWQYDTAMDRWQGIAEFVTEGMSASLFAPALRRYLDREFAGLPLYGWGDPAGDRAGQTVETTPIQILRAHGIPCSAAPSNQPLLRRSALAKPMTRLAHDGKPAFIISPTMRVLRKALQGAYHYKRMQISGSERYSEEPDKNHPWSDVCDSAEYALLGGGERATVRETPWSVDPGDPEPEYAEMGGF